MLDADQVIEAAWADDCIKCGAEHYNCEPDARKYKCEECGQLTVYGASEIVIMELV